jgi:HEAT repeat protein
MPLIRKPSTDAGQLAPPAEGPDFARLCAALEVPGADDRWKAARGLAAFPQAAAVLGAAGASEADAQVREAIFTALARIGTADSAAALAPYIRSDDAGLRTGAMDALKAMPQVLEGVLADLLKDPDADVRVLACDLARELPSALATALLGGVLDMDPEVNVCAAAVDVIADVGSAEALDPLQRCAARFADLSFLQFAIGIARDRLGAQAPRL